MTKKMEGCLVYHDREGGCVGEGGVGVGVGVFVCKDQDPAIGRGPDEGRGIHCRRLLIMKQMLDIVLFNYAL